MEQQLNNLRKCARKMYGKILKTADRFLQRWNVKKRLDSSQAGEAVILRNFFGKEYIGYLIDIGAHDGSSLSNSSIFINSGWKAVLVEPLPGPFTILMQKYKHNPNVTCLNIAISDSKGQQKLFLGMDGPDGMMSTLCSDDNAWFEQTRSKLSIDVQVDTLTNVLISCNCPRNFDLLQIDTEGMDYECLLGMNFDLFHPRVIVTEIYQWNQEKHFKKKALLEEKGYVLYRTVGCNTIWIMKD